jgi:hypothetical protein
MGPGLGASVQPLLSRWRPLAVLALLAAAAFLSVTPGSGFSAGICSGCEGAASAPAGDFQRIGCAACHGTIGSFKPADTSKISVQIRDADGGFLNGPYKADATYTITIQLEESVEPEAANRAGFNLRASGGQLAGVAGESQASSDGLQATHVNGRLATWNVQWTAPHAGAVSFRLFVNDVDGDGAANPEDTPHEIWFGLTDPDGAILGAAAGEEHVEFGISLQQYWIGLFGLMGMIIIMVAGFVYLKFASPHNSDQKDR